MSKGFSDMIFRRFPKTIGFIAKDKFNFYAMGCSAVYFFLFMIFLAMTMGKTHSLDGEKALTAFRIIFLVLPIIFFGKLTIGSFGSSPEKLNFSRFKLILLMVYFILVFLFLCSLADSNTEATTNISTLSTYVLPLLIIASFYNTYETWIRQSGQVNNEFLMNLALSFLYYTLFYLSLNGGYTENQNKAVFSWLIVLSISLVFIFAYASRKSFQTAKSKGEFKKWF